MTIYGRDEGYRYELKSEKVGEIPPPEPLEKEWDSDCVIREGRAGILSEAYLETYRYGRLIERKKVREDGYAPVRGIVGRKHA